DEQRGGRGEEQQALRLRRAGRSRRARDGREGDREPRRREDRGARCRGELAAGEAPDGGEKLHRHRHREDEPADRVELRPREDLRLEAGVDGRRDHQAEERDRQRARARRLAHAAGFVVAFDPLCAARLRWVSTTYFGARADWKPALNTDQRRHISPAQTSAPPSTAAPRLFRPRVARSAAPTVAIPFAARAYLPASPCL